MNNKKYKSYKGAHTFFRLFAEPGFYASFLWVILLLCCMLYPNIYIIKISFVMLSGLWISSFLWIIYTKKTKFIIELKNNPFVTVGNKDSISMKINTSRKITKDWNIRIVTEKNITYNTFKYNKWLYNPLLEKWDGRWGIDNKLGFYDEDLSNVAFEDINWNGEKNIYVDIFGRSRGVTKIIGVRMVRSDPFGWLNCSLFIPIKSISSIYVLPRMKNNNNYKSISNKSSNIKKDIKSKKVVANGDELLGLREARDNDPMKDTHWKSYAKTGKRWVFEKEELRQSKFSIVIDNSLENKNDLESFELLMENVSGQILSERAKKETEWVFIDNENVQINSSNNSWDIVMRKISLLEPCDIKDNDENWNRMEKYWKRISFLKVFTRRKEKEINYWIKRWKKFGINVEVITINGGLTDEI